MNMWAAIVLIVMAAMAAEAWKHHTRARSSSADKEILERLQNRIDELETDLRSRIETLERIATDDKDDLKRRFDHLDKTG